MASYTFSAYGHPNIRATHKNTLEFTKEESLTLQGDCIVGVKADFDKLMLKQFSGKIKIIISAGEFSDEIEAEVNPDFDDEHELVIRNGSFNSKRTFAIHASKAAAQLNRDLVLSCNMITQKMGITIQQE